MYCLVGILSTYPLVCHIYQMTRVTMLAALDSSSTICHPNQLIVCPIFTSMAGSTNELTRVFPHTGHIYQCFVHLVGQQQHHQSGLDFVWDRMKILLLNLFTHTQFTEKCLSLKFIVKDIFRMNCQSNGCSAEMYRTDSKKPYETIINKKTRFLRNFESH